MIGAKGSGAAASFRVECLHAGAIRRNTTKLRFDFRPSVQGGLHGVRADVRNACTAVSWHQLQLPVI